MLKSLDTETTGLDTRHGAKPFFVTMTGEDEITRHWSWPVNPLTREPQIPEGDLLDILREIEEADELVLQNCKFDIAALGTLMGDLHWPWEKTHDTLNAGHILASNQPHDLTSMAMQYLGIDIEPYDKALEKAVKECRTYVSRHLKDWRIAKEGLPDMPSAGDKTWKFDSWLPEALARHFWGVSEARKALAVSFRRMTLEEWGQLPGAFFLPPENEWRKTRLFEFPVHGWYTVLRDYANADSAVTMALWKVMREELRNRGLWKIYEEMRHRPYLAARLERTGVTLSKLRLEEQVEKYGGESVTLAERCEDIARQYDYELELPKSGRNHSLERFIFDVMGVPPVGRTPAGVPTMDKAAIVEMMNAYEEDSDEYNFFKALIDKRSRDTAVQYLRGYRRFWLPLYGKMGGFEYDTGEWYILYPFLNPTGTDTLRWSSQNPNEQNICLSGDSEVLTSDGWVRLDKLIKGQSIAQYWENTGAIDFVVPEIHQPHFKGNMLRVTTENNIDLLMTPKHRCLLRHRKTLQTSVVTADNFKPDYHHLHAGQYTGGWDSTDECSVAWLCAVQADGHYTAHGGIQFVFKKERKIERLKWSMDTLRIKYTESKIGDTTQFHIGKHEPVVTNTKEIMPDKKLGKWLLRYDLDTLRLFSSELFLWDGDSTRNNAYSSSEIQNSDWAQILFTLTGSRAWTRSFTPSSEWSKKDHHVVNVKLGCDYSLTSNFVVEEVPWDDMVYCVTVPSSFFIVRRNGKVSVTGNSAKEGFNIRYAFGPAPGREWWSIDAQNIELRIPAYECGEEAFIRLFEQPNEPPYFGSNHLLISHILHKELFEQCVNEDGVIDGRLFKDQKHTKPYYKRVKNGNFAKQYGGQRRKVDATYGVPGAYDMIGHRFAKQEALTRHWIKFAEKHGYVETMPDKTVDPDRGYPLLCTRTEYNKILPTVPLSYHVQGTACWWMLKAMKRCLKQLDQWNSRFRKEQYRMVMQVHDELVFDFPKAADPVKDPNNSNLGKVRVIQKLMEKGGDDIGVPTPVSIHFHPENWSDEVSL
jgi:DNA polymerase I-like protein with 3'-5' exonuclease and polymerase domains